jgi:APA family basic amino acid/polyamine antiporter
VNSKPALYRVLGLSTAVLLVISSMIGSGIFKKIAPMSSVLGDAGLIMLAWLLAGIISMFGAFTYAGLARLTEEGGGNFEYFRIIYGKFYAFLFGWACFTVIQTASIASIAYVFSESVNNLVGFGSPLGRYEHISIGNYFFPFANSGVKLFTIITIIVLTAINYFGVKKGGLLNDIFSAAKIAGILILIAAGFFLQGESSTTSENTTDIFVQPAGRLLVSAMFTAMLSAFWAYDGWINITYIGGEVKNPRKNIPIAIITGTAVVMILYLLVNFTYLKSMPVSSYVAIDQAGNQIAGAEMAKAVMGDVGYILISILIMVCTFGATNASLMSSPRIYHRMADKGLFFKSFAEVHPLYRTPYKSLFFQAVWACILVISGTFDQLTNMLIFASFIAYGAGAAGLIYLKTKAGRNPELPASNNGGADGNKNIESKLFGYPVIPIIFLLFSAGLVINSLITMPRESVTGIAFILLGIPIYYYLQRKKN